MRLGWLASAFVLVAGVGLIVLSVADGGATVSLFVFIPIVSGSSLVFLLGVLLLVVGFFALAFSLPGPVDEPPDSVPGPTVPASGGAGGLVLIGPVPILFGTWKGVSRTTRWVLALVGAALLIAALLGLFLFVR